MIAMETLKKSAHPSAAQKARLIALLEDDEELRRAKFSVSFTKKEGERRWAAIAEDLNSIPGAKREWKEWRKTWQDMKAMAKNKNAACRFSMTSTGSGPPAPPLSEENIAVLRSISSNALIGHADCKESLVQFEGRSYGFPEAVKRKEENIIVLDSEDLPSSVSPMDETRKDQVLQVAAKDDKIGSNSDKENRKSTKGTNRRAAVRRLEQSIAMGDTMQTLMREKFDLKKKFYETLIAEMRAQTEIMNKICEKF